MRLICPKCGAQYEVDPQVVPPNGRDVQCSNCEHTWFQLPEQNRTNAMEDRPVKAPPSPSSEIDTKSPNDLQDAPPEASQNLPPEITPAAAAPSPRSAVSESVRDILRSEVEFDNSARKSAAASLETQPDLGLENIPAHVPMEQEKQQDTRNAKRRDLLPDIEEINSSLTATPANHAQQNIHAKPDQKPRSTRRGTAALFLFMVIGACLLVALYVFAPVLGDKFPQLKSALSEYITAANAFRGWLNGLAKAASSSLDMILNLLHGTSS